MVDEPTSGGMKVDPPFSEYGHDKSRAILPYRELPNPPTLFFFGDGVSGVHTLTTLTVLSGPLTNDKIRHFCGEARRYPFREAKR